MKVRRHVCRKSSETAELPKRKIEQPTAICGREEFGGLVFDYGFLGAQGEKVTVAIQVARDTRTKMLFVYVLPRQGLTHERGAEKIIKDIKKLGYSEVILK